MKTMKKQQAKNKTYVVYTISYFDQIMYVGKTSNMTRRKSVHRTKRGTHKSAIPVDADMSKVKFNVVAEFNNEEEALKCEDELMLKYNTINNGWNKQRSGLIKASDVKAYMQGYNAAHREEMKAYQREYREAHKEEAAAYNREYREAHKEEIAEYKRDYQAAHRDEINAKRRERRARKKASVRQIEAI